MAEKEPSKEELKKEEPKKEEPEQRTKQSRKSYEGRDEESKVVAQSKTLRKTFFQFLVNPRETVVDIIKEVRKLDYKKFMEKYFYVEKDVSMDTSLG
jgi:hypothetical protein